MSQSLPPMMDVLQNMAGVELPSYLGKAVSVPEDVKTPGSAVVGAVQKRYTPDPDSIPWLLLGAVSADGPGIFHRVTYIQRVNTVGGLAPDYPGTAGEVARVPYTADYYFYRAHR